MPGVWVVVPPLFACSLYPGTGFSVVPKTCGVAIGMRTFAAKQCSPRVPLLLRLEFL